MTIPPELTDALTAIIGIVLTALGAWIVKTIQAKVSNDIAQGALLRLNEAVEHAVRSVGGTLAKEIRKANEDGVITEEEAKQLREAAFSAVKLYLGENGMKELERIMPPEELKRLVMLLVESTLEKMKGKS